MFIFFKEFFEFGRSQHFPSGLLEHHFQIGTFGIVHRFIIYLGKSVQFLPAGFKNSQRFLILHLTQLVQVNIHRVECINGNTVVGIRIHPGMGNGRIVDREDLYSLLVGLCRPVYQFLQISEISYSKTFLTAERKYRDSCSRHLTGR